MTQNCARIRHNFLPCAGEYASTTPSHTIMVVTSNENATLKSKKQWKERKKFHITKGRNLSPFPSISSSGYRFRKGIWAPTWPKTWDGLARIMEQEFECQNPLQSCSFPGGEGKMRTTPYRARMGWRVLGGNDNQGVFFPLLAHRPPSCFCAPPSRFLNLVHIR